MKEIPQGTYNFVALEYIKQQEQRTKKNVKESLEFFEEYGL
jgi:hypothetical protein